MRYARESAASRGYGSRWRKARLIYLADHPLCIKCRGRGRVEPATVVDHIKPHKGDQVLFWDQSNWQPLCKSHHDKDKQQEEGVGFSSDVGGDGMPLDPRHPFYGGAL